MNRQRIANLIILVIVVVGFFAVSAVINLIAAGQSEQAQEFSFVKRTADSHWQEKNWPAAARYYRQLAESDPYNAGAQLAYAYSLTQQLNPILDQMNSDSEDVDLAGLQQQWDALVGETIAAYEKSLPFSQFRNFARVQLSLLHGFEGRSEESIEYLRQALLDGRSTKGLFSAYRFFQCDDVLKDNRIQSLWRSRN